MATVSNTEFDKDVLEAIHRIESHEISYFQPRLKTIRSFLLGSTKSPFYRYFLGHPDISGIYNYVDLEALNSSLKRLVRKNQIEKVTLDYGAFYFRSLIEPEPEQENILISKLCNKEKARLFSAEDFKKLADWTSGRSFTIKGKKKVFKFNKNKIICDSKSELKMLEYIKTNGLASECAGQAYEIEYDTEFRTQKSYFPDITMLTKTGKIAIIEVKPALAMCQHVNIKKYEALARHCKKKGFMYGMIDPDNNYMTYEDLKKLPICLGLSRRFDKWLANIPEGYYSHFDKETGEEWYEACTTKPTKKAFYLQIASLIIKNKLHNFFNNGFLVYSAPVRLDKNNKVVEV